MYLCASVAANRWPCCTRVSAALFLGASFRHGLGKQHVPQIEAGDVCGQQCAVDHPPERGNAWISHEEPQQYIRSQRLRGQCSPPAHELRSKSSASGKSASSAGLVIYDAFVDVFASHAMMIVDLAEVSPEPHDEYIPTRLFRELLGYSEAGELATETQFRCDFGRWGNSTAYRSQNDLQAMQQTGRWMKMLVLWCSIPATLLRSMLRDTAGDNATTKPVKVRLWHRDEHRKVRGLRLFCDDFPSGRIEHSASSMVSSSAQLTAVAGRSARPLSIGICTMVLPSWGEERLVAEWVAYYKALGIDNFYVIDDTPRKKSRLCALLQRWSESGLGSIVCYRWRSGRTLPWTRRQILALNSCLHRFGQHHDWMVLSDVDERIVPIGRAHALPQAAARLQSILQHYSTPAFANASSLRIRNFDVVGPSSRKRDPSSLLIERGTHVCAAGHSMDRERSIFRTGPGRFAWLQTVDQGHAVVIGKPGLELDPHKQIRLHHYWSGSRDCEDFVPLTGNFLTSSPAFHHFIRSRLRASFRSHGHWGWLSPIQRPRRKMLESSVFVAKPAHAQSRDQVTDAIAAMLFNKAMASAVAGHFQQAAEQLWASELRAASVNDTKGSSMIPKLATQGPVKIYYEDLKRKSAGNWAATI